LLYVQNLQRKQIKKHVKSLTRFEWSKFTNKRNQKTRKSKLTCSLSLNKLQYDVWSFWYVL